MQRILFSTMKLLITVLGLCLFSWNVAAQSRTPKSSNKFTKKMQSLDRIGKMTNASARAEVTAAFWEDLVSNNQIPYIYGDSVAFLYKGEADSVQVQGDFNGWGGWASKGFTETRAQRIGNTDIWRLKKAFPKDARLDYKIVVNDKWILDPANPFQQWGGAGPNSELRMPAWKPEPYSQKRNDIVRGNLSKNIRIKSKKLGYDVHYQVYSPADYEDLDKLPVVYVTDGNEYSSEKMGNMVTVLDNLIADKIIRPVIAVFIDQRNPDNLQQNRRRDELPLNDKFIDFVVMELIPEVDYNFKTSGNAQDRAIMGTSLGGLNAAYFGYKASHSFSMLSIHSPAFWYKPDIYSFYENSPKLPLKRIFMSTGVVQDTEEGARKMKAIMESKGYIVQYREVNEGHSWGNWRSLIDEPLVYFFAR